jgi:methylmalonyl-CoA epimerase
MSKEKLSLPRLDHIGLVVKDLEKAIEHFEFLGMGPTVPNVSSRTLDRKVYGKPVEGINNEGAFLEVDPIRLELVRPVQGDSIQKEFLDSRGEGVNHIAFVVDDLNTWVSRFEEAGFKVVYSGRYEEGGGVAYLGTDSVGGVLIEFIQTITGKSM